MRDIAAILALVCLNTIVNTVTSNLHGPFFRAAVACPGTNQTKGLESSSQTNLPWVNRSSSSAWSGSTRCSDQNTVLRVAQTFEGDLATVRLLAHIIGGPAFGLLSDWHGRKVAVVASLGLKAVSAALLAAVATGAASEAASPSSAAPTSITMLLLPTTPIMVAHLLAGAASAQVPLNALLGDISPTSQRGATFTLLIVVIACSGMIGTLLAVKILTRELPLAGYLRVWMAMAIFSPLPSLLLLIVRTGQPGAISAASATPEEDPATLCSSSPTHCSRCMFRAVGGFWRLIRHSDLLQGLCAYLALVAFGLGGVGSLLASYTIGTLGWHQGDLQRLSVAAVAIVPLGAGVLTVFRWALLRMGCAVSAEGPASCMATSRGDDDEATTGGEGVRMQDGGTSEVLIGKLLSPCMGTSATRIVCTSTSSLALGLSALFLTPWLPVTMMTVALLLFVPMLALAPAMLTLITERFEPEQRAQAQAVTIAAANVAFAVAAPFFSRALFDPRATGLRAGLPFALGLVCVLAGRLVAAYTFGAVNQRPTATRDTCELQELNKERS